MPTKSMLKATENNYLKIIIECLVHNLQQNIPLRGHKECRKNIFKVSDINRGNFLELLHFRCMDFPWLTFKRQSQLKTHAQWTSPSIQIKIIDIVSGMVLKRITRTMFKAVSITILSLTRHQILADLSKFHCV